MRMTDRGLIALARHEGIVPAPYLDVKRVWTFGVGHTAARGRARPGPDAARHAGRSRRRHPGGAPALPGRPRPLRGRSAARRDRAARAPRVRCARVLPLQHRRDRPGGADPGSQCRRPGRRGRGVHELAAARQPAPAPRGRARPLPARALPRGADPGLGRRRRRSGRFLAAGAPARRDRGAGAAAARARRRASAAESRPLPGRAAGSPRCSLPSPPPSNGADPMRYVLPNSLDLVGGPRRDPDRPRRARSARAWPARRARRRRSPS